jgi:diguanylate cyclase (GGDEF)-like protein
VLRFAIVTALCLGGAGAAILALTRHFNVVHAEQEAANRSAFVARAMMTERISGADLRAPVGPRRAAMLRRELAPALDQEIRAISVADKHGRIVWSTVPSLVGGRLADAARVSEAMRNVVSSRVATVDTRGSKSKTLSVYVPLVPSDYGRGVAVVSLDYGPIAANALASFYPVAGILELVLVVLYLLLVPLLARASRRMQRQMEQIRHQAHHDDLTGLPNRRAFAERVTSMLRSSALTVILLDLDRFKEVNDTFGHSAGDTLLRDVARRLRTTLPASVVLARLGGDEFGIAAAVEGAPAGIALAQGIGEALRDNFTISAVPVGVEASIGVALAHGDDDIERLLQHADVAMYVAKQGRTGIAVYDEQHDDSRRSEVGLLAELRRALDEREIVLHYQPKAALDTGEVVGVEALVRWNHPQRGLIFPDEFLPYAAHTGINRPLTRYVLDAALADAAEWQRREIDLTVSVNLTMFDLLDVHLADEVAAALEKAGVAPARLELEITESEIMSDVERVQTALAQVRALGVRLAVDDFGRGYSSLTHLKSLPVDTLKIDKSFVLGMAEDARDAALVRTAIDLGHTLDLEVVAEGVETEAAWAQLAEAGCDVAQGYLLSKAIPADDLAAFVRARSRTRRPRMRLAAVRAS